MGGRRKGSRDKHIPLSYFGDLFLFEFYEPIEGALQFLEVAIGKDNLRTSAPPLREVIINSGEKKEGGRERGGERKGGRGERKF